MKLGKALRKAADFYLWDGVAPYVYGAGLPRIYTCDAVVFGGMAKCGSKATDKAVAFLRELGVYVHGFGEFDEFEAGEERQGARFLWLDFAALVAEDEGL